MSEEWKPEPGTMWLDDEGQMWTVLEDGDLQSDEFYRTPGELLEDNSGVPLKRLTTKGVLRDALLDELDRLDIGDDVELSPRSTGYVEALRDVRRWAFWQEDSDE